MPKLWQFTIREARSRWGSRITIVLYTALLIAATGLWGLSWWRTILITSQPRNGGTLWTLQLFDGGIMVQRAAEPPLPDASGSALRLHTVPRDLGSAMINMAMDGNGDGRAHTYGVVGITAGYYERGIPGYIPGYTPHVPPRPAPDSEGDDLNSLFTTGSIPMVTVHYVAIFVTGWVTASILLIALVGLLLSLKPPYRKPGFCPKCGYDLRASPARCPECGRPALSIDVTTT